MNIHSKLKADTHFVFSLELSDLLLMNNQLYPWLILVPRVENAIELIDLSTAQQHLLMDEIDTVSRLLKSIYEPDKLNIATLGNIVRQLHIHVVARYRTDPAWPSPVWGYPGTPYSPENLEKTLKAFLSILNA
jgi:diadenosine tetraphosphate (Ap4A) HIT family hydrolase